MYIIPAIDIIEGKCVRLSKGDYDTMRVYNEDPLEVARTFEDHGFTKLHLVDLDGAKSKRVVNWKVLESIASKTSLDIDFGGGIKTDEDIRIVFESGAAMAGVGSIAVHDKPLFLSWIAHYGSERIMLGADVKDENIAVSGWLEDTAIDIVDFLQDYEAHGVSNVVCTDISRDGMLEGSSMELYEMLRNKFPELNLIASGGVTDIEELHELHRLGCYGAIIGKAIYEGHLQLKELQQFLTYAS